MCCVLCVLCCIADWHAGGVWLVVVVQEFGVWDFDCCSGVGVGMVEVGR